MRIPSACYAGSMPVTRGRGGRDGTGGAPRDHRTTGPHKRARVCRPLPCDLAGRRTRGPCHQTLRLAGRSPTSQLRTAACAVTVSVTGDPRVNVPNVMSRRVDALRIDLLKQAALAHPALGMPCSRVLLTARDRSSSACQNSTSEPDAMLALFRLGISVSCECMGIDSYVGSIAPGKVADIVFWRPDHFMARPELILQGGFITWAAMGDPAAT